MKPMRSAGAPASSRSLTARRRWLKLSASLLLGSMTPGFSRASSAPVILGVRVWPASDYTRVTIESTRPLDIAEHQLPAPDRVVLDLRGLALDPQLRALISRVRPNDPHIREVRVGQFTPDVVRVVLDLKGAVKPKVFSTAPTGKYGYRLMLDLYPESTPSAPSITTISDQPATSRYDLQTRKLIVAIDPGHGGEDPGAIGGEGTYEKHVVLDIARRLRDKIAASPHMDAMMTRDDDFFVPLGTRVEKARSARADIFVSIHADAFTTPTAHGSSVFALSEHGASSEAARWIAKSENAADSLGGLDLKGANASIAPVLYDMSTTQQIDDSLKYGSLVRDALGKVNHLHGVGVEQAGFAVLKAPDIPSILVETAFISNPDEEAKLKSESYRQSMADAIYDGIAKYFSTKPPIKRSLV